MITLRLVAAGNPTKSPDGALGLLVFLGLAVIVVFLFRSMNKHLRKAAAAKYDDAPKAGATTMAGRAEATKSGGASEPGRRPPRPRSDQPRG